MKSATWRGGTYVCSLAAMLCAPALWANQPSPVNVTVDTRYARYGSSLLHVVNRGRETYRITFIPGPAGTLSFRPQLVTLEPGAIADLNLGQLPFAPGVQIFELDSIVSTLAPGQTATGEGHVVTGPTLNEVLVVDSTSVTKSTYQAQFLARRLAILGTSSPDRVDFGGGYTSSRAIGALAFESASLDAVPPFTPIDLPSPVDMADMAPKQLPDFSMPTVRAQQDRSERGVERDASSAAGIGLFGSMKGQVFLKVPAGNSVAFKPAWGWNVRAWQNLGGNWIQVGHAWVKGDGSWQLDFTFPPLGGFPVRIEYQPANRLMQVQDENSNVYTWGDNWNFNAPLTDIGFRSLNLTKTGDAPGIDTIYQAATALWRAFKADGMNAVRDEPIQITYPNTSDVCSHKDGNGNAAPWSCSQADNGKIWLIAKHAKTGVVQHEMGHSIHSYYWNGSMPSGSGGDHSLQLCYNTGLALSEGFADFLTYWVQFDRASTGPQDGYLKYNIETPGPGFCSGSMNETWVSAIFWDMHDTHNDGVAPFADNVSFFHHGATVGTFLNNSGHNAIEEYWLVWATILGGVSTVPIFDLFVLNTVLP